MFQYVLIFDDNVIRKSKKLTKPDYEAADNGTIFIIRLSDLQVYYFGRWRGMLEWRLNQ